MKRSRVPEIQYYKYSKSPHAAVACASGFLFVFPVTGHLSSSFPGTLLCLPQPRLCCLSNTIAGRSRFLRVPGWHRYTLISTHFVSAALLDLRGVTHRKTSQFSLVIGFQESILCFSRCTCRQAEVKNLINTSENQMIGN